MKIVQFEDGTYGIKRTWLFVFDEFLSADKNYDNWWDTTYKVDRLCKHKTLESARERLKYYKNTITYKEIE